MLFYTDSTLIGYKLDVYVIMKILKLLVKPKRKITSYQIKFAVNQTLLNMDLKKEDIGKCVQKVLNYVTLKNRFDGHVHDGLADIGLERIEVEDDGLVFIGKKRNADDRHSNSDMIEKF